MNLITCDELKQKIDRGDDFKLVMSYPELGFRMKHIPGSLNIFSKEMFADLIQPSDEIVVYCTNINCAASINAYNLLEQSGYKDIKRFAGGLDDWESHGYPLQGEQVNVKLVSENSFLTEN